MFDLFSRLSAKVLTFLHLKAKFYRFCVLTLFTIFSAVVAMLPKVRMCEHLGISALTRKRVKGDDCSAVKEHLWPIVGHGAPFILQSHT